MILSHKYKFIFIHIGKTGGTSIEHSLSQAINMSLDETQYNKEIIDNVGKISGFTPTWATEKDHTGRINCKHITAIQLSQIVGHRIWEKYFKFSFVRNPYDMLLSQFSMFSQFEAFKNHPWAKYPSFRDFCSAIVSGEQTIPTNPYHSYLADNDDVLIVDFVGKFETLHEDFDKICGYIGLQDIKLPHIGPTDHRPFAEYYTPEMREMIYSIRKEDFRSFGYSKQIDNLGHLPFIQKLLILLRYYRYYSSSARKLRKAARKLIK